MLPMTLVDSGVVIMSLIFELNGVSSFWVCRDEMYFPFSLFLISVTK